MNSPQIRILLVEDDDEDALILKKMLGKSDSSNQLYEIKVVTNLSDAARALGDQDYNLVLLDLSLPDGRGLETFSKLHEQTHRVPIVICSGLNDKELALKAIRLGAQDYLIKGQTNQAQFEQVIRFSLERFELEKIREEFVSMVIHELRSPLMISREFLDLILKKQFGKLSIEQERYLTLIKKTMERLNRVIDGLLDITKYQLGKIELKNETFDLVNLIQKILIFYYEHAVSKQLELKQELPLRCIVSGDQEKIEQVLMNLISNAIKFTQKGSVEVTLKEAGEKIECKIRDTGPGIPEKARAEIFDKFHQFGRTKGTKGEKGTGLGLAICKEIVTAHRGEITVKSQEGLGSEFVVALPKSAA